MAEAGSIPGVGTVMMVVDKDTGEAVFLTAIGTPADEPWDGVAAEATVISLLKKIALNTTPAPP